MVTVTLCTFGLVASITGVIGKSVEGGWIYPAIAILLLPVLIYIAGYVTDRIRGLQEPGGRDTEDALVRPGFLVADALRNHPGAADVHARAVGYWLFQRTMLAFLIAMVVSFIALVPTPRPVGLSVAVVLVTGFGLWLWRWSVPALDHSARRTLPALIRRFRFAGSALLIVLSVVTAMVALVFPTDSDPRFGFGFLAHMLCYLLIAVWAMIWLGRLAWRTLRTTAHGLFQALRVARRWSASGKR